jgi:hypothetical protein
VLDKGLRIESIKGHRDKEQRLISTKGDNMTRADEVTANIELGVNKQEQLIKHWKDGNLKEVKRMLKIQRSILNSVEECMKEQLYNNL